MNESPREISISDLYNLLTYALDECGTWPWSVCIEFATPLPEIAGHSWRPIQHRMTPAGVLVSGYSRAQAKAVKRALEPLLLAQVERCAGQVQAAARELGIPLEDP